MLWNSIEFHLLQLLGDGSQGRVYKAIRRDRRSGLSQTVAVKILHSRTAVNLWRQEFESLARVDSPHCVRVLSFERIRRRPALVLEYIEGVSLSELVRRQALEGLEIEEILAQLEAALKTLAECGVFHGDLSPHNILVDVEGRVKVLDFGLANSHASSTRLTPEFASPERLLGGGACLTSDLFSLGKIEVFLRNRETRETLASPYLNVLPGDRRIQNLQPCPRRQSRLAERVQGQLRSQRQAQVRTQPVSATIDSPAHWPCLRLLSVSVVLVFLTNTSASQGRRTQRWGTLMVRTEKWVNLRVNGHPIGFAPVTISLAAGQNHLLEWDSALGHGQKNIQIKGLQTRLLRDRDFLH
jgi:serine/threonine protein kinase